MVFDSDYICVVYIFLSNIVEKFAFIRLKLFCNIYKATFKKENFSII